ncbi:MAG: tetratricopeptide repeat protein, partial [Planctomycetota bacterium]
MGEHEALQKAKSFLESGDYEGAVKAFEEARDAGALVGMKRSDYGYALVMVERADEAEEVLEAVLEGSPQDQVALHGMAMINLQRGDSKGAVRWYEELERLDPENWVNLANLAATVANVPGEEDWERSRDLLSRAVSFAPDNASLHMSLAASYLHLAEHAMAESVARKSTELAPAQPDGWGLLGSALRLQEKFEEAIPSFDRCIEIAAENPQAHEERAYCLMRLERWDECRKSAEEAVRLWPDAFDGHVCAALAAQEQQDWEALLTHGEFLCGADSQEAFFQVLQSRALVMLDRGWEAIAHLQEALELDKDSVEAHLLLGGLWIDVGRPDEAKVNLSALESLD